MNNENYLLIKFDNENDALSAIKLLDSQHSIRHHKGIVCSAILKKDADSNVEVLDKYSAKKIHVIDDLKGADIDSSVALGSYTFTELGSLDWVILTISGAIKSIVAEIKDFVIEEKFIHEAKRHLEDNNIVIVAHAVEEDCTIIDKLMADCNGEITRTPVS